MLEPTKGSWNIVVVGLWNISIFSPSWLSRYVFGETDLEIEYPITPGQPLRITGDRVHLIPKRDRVMLNPVELSSENLTKMETFACKLLQNLQHTPVSASGVNFGFEYTGDNADMVIDDHFQSIDDTRFSDQDLSLRERTFIRSLDCDDWVLNLKTIIKESNLRFEFNFHAATASAEISRVKIKGSVLGLRDKAEAILKDIYNLTKEES
jgi:hypothetical protein